MSKVTSTVKEWFSNANEDLRVAQALWGLGPEKYLKTIPYHCQYPDASQKNEATVKDSEEAIVLAKKVFLAMSKLIPFDSPWEI